MTKRIQQLFVTLAALALGGAVFAHAQTAPSTSPERITAVDKLAGLLRRARNAAPRGADVWLTLRCAPAGIETEPARAPGWGETVEAAPFRDESALPQ